jgi:isopenicillin-N N-acyltransferase-like protein
MSTKAIPLIEFQGTHREVGRQIGAHFREHIGASLGRLRENLPAGVSWEDMLHQGELYLAYSRRIYPRYLEELEGIAEEAQVPFEVLFLSMCEELWETPAWRDPTWRVRGGCTDLAARGRATVGGATLIAHTNDLGPAAENELVLLKIKAGDDPEFLGVSPGGVGYSAGFNAAGVSLTGNQLYSNDLRPGVPRLLVTRAILAANRLGEALNHCLLPHRASSYNNLLADRCGEVYSMEGSATDVEPIYISEDVLAHANHYTSARMYRFEADPGKIGDSITRYERALRLLRESYGEITPECMRGMLADHANYPASICKHAGPVVTVFSMIIHVEALHAWIGRGRPCEATFHEYSLEPWTPPADWPRN